MRNHIIFYSILLLFCDFSRQYPQTSPKMCGLLNSGTLTSMSDSLKKVLLHDCGLNFENLQKGRTTQSSPNAMLPDNLRPISYQLYIDPSMDTYEFQGHVTIRFQVVKNTHHIVLNAQELKITNYNLKEEVPSRVSRSQETWKKEGEKNNQIVSIVANQLDIPRVRNNTKHAVNVSFPGGLNEDVRITSLEVNGTNEMINFTVNKLMNEGSFYVLSINFSGPIRDDLMGFYKTSYKDENNNTRPMLMTQFQMVEARSVFPCFDEPKYKATFTITICHPKDMIALSNMPSLTSYEKFQNPNKVCDGFGTTVIMPTYLVAFVITDFDSKKCSNSPVPITVWAPRNKIHMHKFACDIAPSMLRYFIEYTGLPYQLPKIDLVAAPELFAFGMENWGLITFSSDLLLVDESSSKVQQMKHEAAQLIAHEMAHQWFGNLVTSSWWSEIWINEGLSTYLALLAVESVLPEFNSTVWFLMDPQQKTLYHDTFLSTRPIFSQYLDLDNLQSIFDGISYWKGSSLTRMLRHMVTSKTFQKALRNYLTIYEYQNAGTDELWQQMTLAAHEDGTMPKNITVEEVMDSWTYNAGYPIITLSRHDNGSISISQERFLRDETKLTAIPYTSHNFWWIPLSVATPNSPNETKPTYWLAPSKNATYVEDFPNSNQWYIINQRQTGFFRVNYDLQNWKLLTKQFHADPSVFDEVTRCQILDDAFTLANTDQVSYRIPLTIVKFVKNDLSPYVLYIALQNIFPLTTIYDQDALFGSLSTYFSSIFSSHFESIGFGRRLPETTFVNEAKDMLIQRLCHIHLPCVKSAKELFHVWTQNRTNYGIAKSSLVGTIFCIAISEGGIKEWELIWEELRLNRRSRYKDELIKALGCSRHHWILNRYFMKIFTEPNLFSDHVILQVFQSVSSNPNGIDVAWDTTRRLWPRLSIANNIGQTILQMVIPNMRTPRHFEELKTFLEKNVYIDPGVLDEPMKSLTKKLHFYNQKYKELFLWAQENYEDIPQIDPSEFEL